MSMRLRNSLLSLLFLLFTAEANLILPKTAYAEAKKHETKPKKEEKKAKKEGKKSEKKANEVEPVKKEIIIKEEKLAEPEILMKEVIKGEETNIDTDKLDKEVAQLGKIDAVLIIDSSRSMQKTDPTKLREQAAKLFVRLLSEGDRLAILSFDKETKQVMPLTEIKQEVIDSFDQAIAGIQYEGGFTDIEAPILEAYKVLVEQGRKDVLKSVLLLSDGKMDPHPDKGTAEQLINQTEKVDLFRYKINKIKLYTVALSEQSDHELLSRFSKITEGLSLLALDSSTLHKKFSELFLTIKQPQLLALEDENFEIDSSVKESTFFISRNEKITSLNIIDPLGNEITRDKIAPKVKWYTDDKVDLITIYEPLPGRWKLQSNEKLEGFARLLTDVKLHVHFPAGSFNFGDSVAVYAKLINKEEEINKIDKEDLANITFYSYKIIDINSGEVAFNGILNDKGENGDVTAGDGIYSAVIKLDQKGEFQALFGVTAPTFTRQQRFPITVAQESVKIKALYEKSLEKNENQQQEEKHQEDGSPVVNEDENHETSFEVVSEPQKLKGIQVALSNGLAKLKDLKVKLILKTIDIVPKNNEEKKQSEEKEIKGTKEKKVEKKKDNFIVTLKPDNKDPLIYEYPVEKIEAGEYDAYARITAIDEKGREFTATSSSLKIDVEEKEEDKILMQVDEVKLITGVSSIFLSFIWISVVVLSIRKKNRHSKSLFEVTKEESSSESLKKQLEDLKSKVSKTKRKQNEKDLEIFEEVADAFSEGDIINGNKEEAHGESELIEDKQASEEISLAQENSEH